MISSFPIINLCKKQYGATIYCDSPSFSDDQQINNLIEDNNENGYLASSFVKTPLDITISFNYPIDLERIGIKCKVGTCYTDTISIYISTESMEEINDKMIKTLMNRTNQAKDVEMKDNSSSTTNGKHYLTIPTTNNLLPRGIPPFPTPNNIYNNNNNNLSLDNNNKMVKSLLYDNINQLSSNSSHNNSINDNINTKSSQLKYIHQQFKFVGSVDNLHSQDDLYTYMCNSNFNYRGQSLPSTFLSKIQKQSQLKPFHFNSNLLISVKSIRIRILKVHQSSCPAIGGIEIWGTPSIQFTPVDQLQNIYQIYQMNSIKQQQQQVPNFNNNPFKSNLLDSLNNGNNNNNNHPVLDLFPKNKHYNSEDVMKVEISPPLSSSNHHPSIINEFEEFMKSHPEIKLNETGIPTIFLDPITLEMMKDPVILKSGNIVDKSTIETHFKNGYFTDPFTGLKMVPEDIESNILLKSQIQTFINEKKKRKRLLKSHSMILRNQILVNMQPQIATVDIVNNNNNSNNNNNNNQIFNPFNTDNDSNSSSYFSSTPSTSLSNSLASSTSSTNNSFNGVPELKNSNEIFNILNSPNINFQNAEVLLSVTKKDPQQYLLSKMPSQFSFIELPIKKNKK